MKGLENMKVVKNNKQNLKKDFIWNTIGSTVNAFSSLFYMIIVTRLNGVTDAGIFTFAFSTATLFYIIGIYAGRTYQVTDSDKISNHDYLVNKYITCIAMIIFSIIFILYKNYSFNKTIIILVLCFLKMIEAFSEFFYAYMQKNNLLYKVGISLTLKTFLSIFIFLVIDLLTRNILFSSVFMIISYLLIMFMYDFKQFKLSEIIKEPANKKNIIDIFIKGFFTFSLSFLTMYIINIPRYSVDRYLIDEFNTIFGILIMPASAMVLLSQFVFQPLLMKIKSNLDENNYNALKKLIIKMALFIILLGIFVLILAYFLGIPVLQLVYGVNLSHYRMSLMYIIIGSILYSIVIIFSNIMISMRVTFFQVIIYIVNVLISLFISDMLVNNFKVAGACMAYCFTMIILFVCFMLLVIFSINSKVRKCQNG